MYHLCAQTQKDEAREYIIARHVPKLLKEQWTDSEGRVLFVKGTFGFLKSTLATIYSLLSTSDIFTKNTRETTGLGGSCPTHGQGSESYGRS